MSSASASLYVCVRGSRFVCKRWLQPCLNLSCWAALAVKVGGRTPPLSCLRLSSPQPLSLHRLLSLGRRWHVPGCSAGWCGRCRRCDCREGYPSLAAPSAWSLSPSAGDAVPHDVLGAEACPFPDPMHCELACSQLGPLQ